MFFFQLVLISWTLTLSSCLIWQIMSFILPPNEYSCVYAYTRFDLQKMPILAKKKKKTFFQMKLILSLADMQTSKIVAFGAQKTRIHTLKCRCTQNESLFLADFVQSHNWVIFLRKWARRGRYSQWRSLSRNIETNFCSQKLKRRILTIFANAAMFSPCFWRSHYQPQSWCRLATSELRFDTVALLFVGCRQR